MPKDFDLQQKDYQYDILDSIFKEIYGKNDDLEYHIGLINAHNKNIRNKNQENLNLEESIKEEEFEQEIEVHKKNISINKDLINDWEKGIENQNKIIDNSMNKKISFNTFNKHIRKVALGQNIKDSIEEEDFSLDNAVKRANAVRRGLISLIVGEGYKEGLEHEVEDKMPGHVYNNLLKAGQQTINRSKGTSAYSKFTQFSDYTKEEVAKELGLRMSNDSISSIMEEKEKKLFGEVVNTPYNLKGKKSNEIVSDNEKTYDGINKENISAYAKSLKEMKKIIDAKPWYKKIFNSHHNEQKVALENAKKTLIEKGVDLEALNNYLNSNEKNQDKSLEDMLNKSTEGIDRCDFENSKRKGLIDKDLTYEQAKQKLMEFQTELLNVKEASQDYNQLENTNIKMTNTKNLVKEEKNILNEYDNIEEEIENIK